MRRPGLPAFLAILGLVGFFSLAVWLVRDWRFHDELSQSRREIAGGKHQLARDRLARLATLRPKDPEVAYQLGLCERVLGHPEASLKALSAVPDDSPPGSQAALLRAKTLIHSFGRLSEAEAVLRIALKGSASTATAASWALAEMFVWEGRLNDARRVLESSWARSPASGRISLLREHWRIDQVVVAEGVLKPIIDSAAQHNPADPRVALTRASLADRYGRNEEAESLLNSCRAAQPEDPAVWNAWLQWALHADRPDQAAIALRHLRADQIRPAERLSLHAWFSARRHDSVSEQAALAALVSLNPGDAPALERLAILSAEHGDTQAAANWRKKQTAAVQTATRYRWSLLNLPENPERPALEELAHQAEELGRDFEARGWWTLVVARAPGDLRPRVALTRLSLLEKKRLIPPEASPERIKADLDLILPNSPSAPNEPLVATFVEAAKEVGLDTTYVSPRTSHFQVPEVMGGGAALIDYDSDGWLDVFIVQGGTDFPPPPGPRRNADQLFRNKRNGSFEDVSEKSGVASMPPGFSFGVTSADYDNDGNPDLFITRWNSYLLLRNNGDGTFEDATEKAGLSGNRDWSSSAAFADFDNDGDLDLYVCHYLDWDAANPPICYSNRFANRVVTCLPLRFPSKPDHLFRNDVGRFVDVSDQAGITKADTNGRGLGVVAADLDADGRIDLYVANDQSSNYLFHNLGNLKFEEVGFETGAACASDGVFRAGMGVACGDLDGDGRPDLAVTNFFGESTTFFRNLGGGSFSDQTAAIGLAAPSRFLLGFGVSFLDANNDGRLDLATANGHVNDETPASPYAMTAQLLLGDQNGRLVDVSAKAGPPWQSPIIGRGLASGDLDNDGRIDLLFIPENHPVVYAHNTTSNPATHFVTFLLQGAQSNRDAIGARITILAGGRRQTSWRLGGGSYQSSSDHRLHFGLGQSTQVEKLEIAWPSGRVDHLRDLAADTGYLLLEGEVSPKPLQGFKPKP